MDEKKQIEEMALEIAKLFCNPKGCYNCNLCDAYGSLELSCEEYLSYRRMASVLYAAGYRKQSEAEWIIIDPNPQFVEECKQIVVDCSNCTIRRTIPAANYHGYNYCPNCGAKMKGE